MLRNLGNWGMAAEDGPWLVARSTCQCSSGSDHLYDELDVGNIRVLVADDHRVESHVVEVDRQGEGERVVVADPVHRMHPTGNLEGEVLVEHRMWALSIGPRQKAWN